MNAIRQNLADLSWLAEVRNAEQPLDLAHCVWVRSHLVEAGPCIAPERHPNCEFCLIEHGDGVLFAGREKLGCRAGDLLVLGSGVPHWCQINGYPFQFTAIHFLPLLLFELGPAEEAARILHRFTAQQSLTNRLIRPNKELREYFQNRCNQINTEFRERRFGWEIRLRTVLMDMIIVLMRSEQVKTRTKPFTGPAMDLAPLELALTYLKNHISQPIYTRDVAAAARVSESRLKLLFRQMMGTSWSQYLQAYRIHLAAARLGEPGRSITEIASDVGFENLGHFCTTFRALMGLSPRQYVKSLIRQSSETIPHNRSLKSNYLTEN